MNALPRERYTVRDIFIDRDGVWHERGLRTTPANVLPGCDVAVIALHGAYGEDGTVQRILEQFGILYTGSDSFASFQALHKVIAREKARAAGLNVPRYQFIERPEDAERIAHEAVRTYPQPVVVRPVRWGSSAGMTTPAGFQPVHQAVTGLFAEGAEGALIEENVRGERVSVGIIENMRGESLYVLPAIGTNRAPARLGKHIQDELQTLAKRMHHELSLSQYSSSAFVISPKGIVYLHTDPLPGLYHDAHLPQALAAVGIRPDEFAAHIIALALEGRKR
jgi:D-alanine-D-alanine ligase